MAGSNREKFRGLCVKKRVKLELFLNCIGVRVDKEEREGLLRKTDGANRYARSSAVGSGSDGSDQGGPRSNLGPRLRIGRLLGDWGSPAALSRRSASAPRRRVPGEGQGGAPGLILGCGLVRELVRGTRKPLGHSGERIGARNAVSGGDGGRTRRSSPARAF